jgi:hypothetical protein
MNLNNERNFLKSALHCSAGHSRKPFLRMYIHMYIHVFKQHGRSCTWSNTHLVNKKYFDTWLLIWMNSEICHLFYSQLNILFDLYIKNITGTCCIWHIFSALGWSQPFNIPTPSCLKKPGPW